jgi:hypothetical protein
LAHDKVLKMQSITLVGGIPFWLDWVVEA